MKKLNHREQKHSSTVRFLELDRAKTAVTASLRSAGSRRCYEHAISEFIDWYCSEPRLGFNKAVVTRYRMYLESRRLAPGTVNLRLAAIRRLAFEAADVGLLSPEQAAGIRRVKGAKKLGVRIGNWVLAKEARALWELPDAKTLKGKRDRAILKPKAGIVGGLTTALMFFITSTMVITTPGAVIAVQGIRYMRYMSFLGLFLFKDVISLGASFYLISYFGRKAILSENKGK